LGADAGMSLIAAASIPAFYSTLFGLCVSVLLLLASHFLKYVPFM
jgi:hypothetical protein